VVFLNYGVDFGGKLEFHLKTPKHNISMHLCRYVASDTESYGCNNII